MRKRWKRWLAGVMTAVMLIAALPTAAYAAVGDLLNMSAVQRTALLEALEEVYGNDAEAYLAILEQYGLIDEDGNLVTDEKIVMDGVEYTLDEIEAILDDPDTDLSKVVEVDGTFLTLEELKTVVEIERYLAYLEATYFTRQELTDEQVASFCDLAQAWANGGVQLLAANGLDGVGPAGVDHGVRLNVSAAGTASEHSTYTVTVTPTKAQEKDITFSWRALGGSVEASGSGTETIPANSTDSVTLNITVGDVKGQTQGDATFLVHLYGLTNALFSDGSTSFEQKVTVSRNDSFKYSGTASTTLSGTNGSYCIFPNEDCELEGDSSFGDKVQNGENTMIQMDSKTLSVSGLSEGIYSSTIEFQ